MLFVGRKAQRCDPFALGTTNHLLSFPRQAVIVVADVCYDFICNTEVLLYVHHVFSFDWSRCRNVFFVFFFMFFSCKIIFFFSFSRRFVAFASNAGDVRTGPELGWRNRFIRRGRRCHVRQRPGKDSFHGTPPPPPARARPTYFFNVGNRFYQTASAIVRWVRYGLPFLVGPTWAM